ncbi:MAG: ABC transporter permease [Candidatus Bipolaricaulota bacterium]|nr:ABC transporter permease [Candidatus Bipolaricaulota bacterium]
MRSREILTVWQREILDTLRDRRSLVLMIVVPLVVMPIFVLLPSLLVQQERAEMGKVAQPIVVHNGAEAPGLVAAIQASGVLKIVEHPDPERALQEGQIALWVMIPSGLEEKLAQGEPVEVRAKFNPGRSPSRSAREKFDALWEGYHRQFVAQKLAEQGCPPELVRPAPVNYEASQEQVGMAFLSLLLPLFLVMWAAMGGYYTALEAAVGEKERKTLETLLVAPVSRSSIVIGKVLAILVVTIFAEVISIAGLLAALFAVPRLLQVETLAGLKFALTPEIVLLIVALMAALAAMMSAVIFALFFYTRSIREAQSHANWVTFGVMIPALIAQFREIEPSLTMLLVPVFNVVLVFKELLLGQINVMHLGVVLSSSLVYAIVAIWIAVRIFQDERVLFRQ